MTHHRTTKTADPTPEQSLDALIAEMEHLNLQFESLRSSCLFLLERIAPLLIEAADLELDSGLPADISGLCAELERLCSLEPASPTDSAAEAATVPSLIERMLFIMRELRKLLPRLHSLITDAREIRHLMQLAASDRQAEVTQRIAELMNKRIAKVSDGCNELVAQVDKQLEEARRLQLDLTSTIPDELARLNDTLRAMFEPGAAPASTPGPTLDEFLDRRIAIADRIQKLAAKLSKMIIAERNKQAAAN
ncbi:MAG: hypothetical protein IJ228_09010 [Succinivibrio sp.]|nr:hypothetical protein [Succinivibrio sp.]